MSRNRIRRYIRHGMLPQLSVFEAVARLGSFTRAAEELHMAQPTVSVHIKKLTETIGLPLLEQVGKTIRLTSAGRELLATGNDIFETFARFEQKLADARGLQSGTLSIMASPVAEEFASRMLIDFARHYPTIEVRMRVGTRQELLDQLAGNNDDFYMMTSPPVDNEIVLLRLLPDPLVVAARREHALAGQASIPFSRFATEPLLAQPAGAEIRLLTEQLFRRQETRPLIRLELGSQKAMHKALVEGLGVAVMPAHAVNTEAGSPLTILNVEGFPLESCPYMVYPVDRQPSFIAQTFLDFVRKEVQHRNRHAAISLVPATPARETLFPDQGDRYRRKMDDLAGYRTQ